MGTFDFLNNDVTIAEAKKKRKILTIIVISIIAVAVIIGLIAIIKNFNSAPEEPIVEKINVKIDSSKDFVYNATYENSKYDTKNIILPYININTDTAKNVNEEIKGIFDTLTATDPNSSDENPFFAKASYKNYTTGEILSIIITVESGNVENPSIKYYTYNFSLVSLIDLEYQALYKTIGKSTQEVQNEIEEAIKNEITGSYSNSNDTTNLENDINTSINTYKSDVYNHKLKMYLDGKDLNIIVTLKDSTKENGYITKTIKVVNKK